MDVKDLLADPPCTCLLHNSDVKNKKSESADGHTVIEDKVIALFFTSNWCEPCHTFTKVLSQAHRTMDKRSSEVVVINVPVESDPDDAKYCFDRMPDDWYMIPSDSQLIKDLMNKYSVRTIPRLIACKSDGTTITTKGRSEIESRMSGAAFNWIESSRPKPKQLVNGFDLDEVQEGNS